MNIKLLFSFLLSLFIISCNADEEGDVDAGGIDIKLAEQNGFTFDGEFYPTPCANYKIITPSYNSKALVLDLNDYCRDLNNEISFDFRDIVEMPEGTTIIDMVSEYNANMLINVDGNHATVYDHFYGKVIIKKNDNEYLINYELDYVADEEFKVVGGYKGVIELVED